MEDPWAAFPDAPEDDPWADFPDDEPEQEPKKRRKRKGKRNAPKAPERFVDPEATDGDTIRDRDFRLRLQGIDAPELGQLGYRADGSSVPLGEQSQAYLAQRLYTPENLSMAAQARPSFGRAVAPLMNNGQDVGLSSLRAGQSFAAPEYISDPHMRFDYMEAQRLGRQNRLGVHGVETVTPKEHRLDPDWQQRDRGLTGRPIDMPTPFAGLTEEEERGWIETLYNGSEKEIVDYARSVGMQIDEERNSKWVEQRDKFVANGGDVRDFVRPEAIYTQAPQPLIDPGGGQAGAAARSTTGGFLFGALDELGAGADTLGLTPGRENIWNSDRRFGDVYWNNLDQNQSELAYDDVNYPITTTVGEIAGNIVGGFAVPYGAGVRSARGLAAVGGGFGGAEGFLGTDGSVSDRLTGTAQGVAIGAVGNAALGKAVEAIAPLAIRGWRSVRGQSSSSPAPAIGRPVENPEAVAEAQANWAENVRVLEQGEADIVERALYHPEMGALDMRWGQPGNPDRDWKGGYGLSHILAKHRDEGVVENLPERIAGMRVKEVDPRHSDRVILEGETGRAVVATTWHGDEQRWLITAYDPNWKPSPAETSPPSAIGGGPDSGLREGTQYIGEKPSLSYDATNLAMAANTGPSLSQNPTRPLTQPNTRADLMASTANVQPRDVVPMPSNFVEGDEVSAINAGRFAPARAANERSALDRQMVRNWRGEDVPKVGPLDMVGYIRSLGGLRDQGGELSHLGMTNAARTGMDHVGQETRFGPLVAESGMSLDEAALEAWEEGYFPELSQRPDVNTFLDALGETYNGGRGRRFLPEDQPQVGAFDAMRVERQDIERQQADGPVFEDRSGVADQAPFPPVQAYEDWAGESVERIGNIDVSKLDTPQDISRALKTTYNSLGGMDAATRRRMSQAETARLADDLGMTAEQLLSRRQGQAFNAEQALAARQILAKSGNELVNAARRIQRQETPNADDLAAFREMMVRHAAIQEQVSGATAEAGRTLAQFKMSANSRAVTDQVLNGFVRSGGGEGDLKDAAEALIDAAELGPGKFCTVVRHANKPKFRDKVSELYINSLLSNPPTHVVNMVSNSLTAMAQIPEYALASGIGAARRAAIGDVMENRILASEVGARTFGLVQGIKEGADLFARALRTGEADDFVSKVEGDQYKAIGGFKGKLVRIPTRLLTAEDQFFKGIARRMELNAQAVRIAHREGLKGEARKERIAELVANPTDAMMERAMEYGRYLTFQRPLTGIGQDVSRAASKSLAVKVIVPFVRTPINLLKFATERSPAAPLLREWRDDFRAGGERRDLALAKAMIGTGFGTLFYQAAQQGIITGAVPKDRRRGGLMRADGWQPYSIKIGDRYVSYARMDPFSTTLGVAADMATLPDGMSEKQRENMATVVTASILNNLASKTWLSGVSSLSEALIDPERYAESWLERTAGSMAVPAVVAGAARQLDPVLRDREGMGEAVQSRIPGLSQGLPPRRDVFGEPIELDSLGPDFISPFWQSQAKNDPVIAEMLRINKGVTRVRKNYSQEGERLDYTREQYDRYQEIAGRLTYNRLLALIASQGYSAVGENGKRKMAKKAIENARNTARGLIDDPDYPLPAKGAPAPGEDPWSQFPDDDGGSVGSVSDVWDAFPDDDGG